MRTTHRSMTAILGLILTGCAGIATAPTPEARQALAPTGKLRVGLYRGNPLSVTQDPASGEMKGVGFDLGKELARRMGVLFEPVVYPSSGAIVASAKSSQWDVTFLAVSAPRAKEMDFTAAAVEIERGYLVPSDSSILTAADVDRAGIRVAVAAKGGSDIFLSRALKNAVVVPVVVGGSGDAVASEMLKTGRAEDLLPTKQPCTNCWIGCPVSEFLTVGLLPSRWQWLSRRDGTSAWPTRADLLRTPSLRDS
jgi:polar amino acid transport system substrate-binding protein